MIEVPATRRTLPLGMTATRFLREYWQRKPLLVRGAFPAFADPLTPNDLAGLAGEEFALSRLITRLPRDRWRLRNGPFGAADFAKQPKRDWTLLVQDVDKSDADVRMLLNGFDFLPSWRIDDIMVSYAVDGGSVGAHVDQYDVFLLQGLGCRRWQISTDAAAPKEFREDADIKLLRTFTPTHEWLLQPGDMLYLPPGVPHHGVAVGECLTYSIGMRAPSFAEMLVDFAETFAETLPENLRFGDPDLAPATNRGEIDEAAFGRVARAMPWLRLDDGLRDSGRETFRRERGTDGCSGRVESSMLRTWFARFITRYRSAYTAMPRTRRITDAQFNRAFAAGAEAVRNPWSRAAWFRSARGAMLVVAGTEQECSIPLAQRVCSHATVPLDGVRSRKDRDALRSLIDLGHVTLHASKRRSRK
ncbi:MAG TPA: cupin domain-containing protein [Rhodanobacteraceae bacterium]|jgi:50S ribosomal protein L16 3-hydroxylase|nr:cupin domain-containing protein [Rhodanobacteraceae bacterium]